MNYSLFDIPNFIFLAAWVIPSVTRIVPWLVHPKTALFNFEGKEGTSFSFKTCSGECCCCWCCCWLSRKSWDYEKEIYLLFVAGSSHAYVSRGRNVCWWWWYLPTPQNKLNPYVLDALLSGAKWGKVLNYLLLQRLIGSCILTLKVGR